MIHDEGIEKIIKRISEGDLMAENYLFRHLNEKIKFLVRVHLKGKIRDEDQQDIISEIYHAVLISLRKGRYNPYMGKSLEAYISGITGNVVGQYFRKQKKELSKDNTIEFFNIVYEENILKEIIDNERRERLKACLKRIKPKYQQVLILKFYEDKSLDEISKKLKLGKRRISERINYAIKLFLKEYKKDKYFNS